MRGDVKDRVVKVSVLLPLMAWEMQLSSVEGRGCRPNPRGGELKEHKRLCTLLVASILDDRKDAARGGWKCLVSVGVLT